MFRPVVLAGGRGTRLWPASRTLYPKQFQQLMGEGSMLQQTLGRLTGLDHDPACVVCNEVHRFLVAEQLQAAAWSDSEILLEPAARDTAPAIALAALAAQDDGADPLLLVLPADHVIADIAAFQRTLAVVLRLADSGKLVTFGIVPTGPETGYGYIQRGEASAGGYRISAFVEKPDAPTANRYVTSGEYFWNSGMFAFRASRYLEELARFEPAILSACQAAFAGATRDLGFCRVDAEAFARCPAKSVDYAVMERTDAAVVVPLDAGWSDIGSWSALWSAGKKDVDGNVLQGDVVVDGCSNSLVRADSRLVVALGVNDLVIVETKDAVLVACRSEIQRIKQLVARLKAQGRAEPDTHREVSRPWGKYDSVDIGARHQVKRITVKPGGKISLQMHHHRAEHWVVVAGTAEVTNGDRKYLVTENESTFIPIGCVHSLENVGVIPLELIEVQSGSYLGEDDIVRLEDRYGRH
ncbi:MAG TPA: mannose-1-phosphate guanylyltransferase/mannose-6-phosphate isomerase [Nevskiaceae bacterium]